MLVWSTKMDKFYKNDQSIQQNKDIGKVLQIGHYLIINSKKASEQNRIAIYGLGSCVAPIIIDKQNKYAGISHILLPSANGRNSMEFPHKYANLSIKFLIKELMKHGSNTRDLIAIIIGGANIFQNEDWIVGNENVQMVERELKKFQINIVKREIGGSKGRIIIFDPKSFTIYSKLTGEKEYRILWNLS